jgi:hypothetical protein
MSYLRQRINFQSGVVSGTITNIQTTIPGISFSTPITAGYAVPVVLNPSYYGSTTSPEIIYVTSVSGNVATVLRAQEGTTGVSGTSLPWVAGPLASDFGITNQITNGDFPTPIASGQVLTSTASGINAPVWNTPSGPLASGVTVSGYQIYGDLSTNATISGSRVIGVPNQTITQYTASGTSQGSATLITTQYATVIGATATSNSSAGKAGVILTSITTSGQAVTIDNTDASHWLLIYPATGQSIDGAGNNNPVWIAPSAYWYGVAENSTNWATVVPSINSGIGVSSTYGNGSITLSSALSMSTVNAGTPVTLSGFNNYLILVNGYGTRNSTGYLTTSFNYNGNMVVQANTTSTSGAYYSLSNMGVVSPGTGSWTATVTNTGYSNGSGFAIVIGIN